MPAGHPTRGTTRAGFPLPVATQRRCPWTCRPPAAACPCRWTSVTAPRVGAAGLGWDVPLSYVRRTTSIAHRRPASARTLQGREQVTVSLLGQTLDMVRRGQEW